MATTIPAMDEQRQLCGLVFAVSPFGPGGIILLPGGFWHGATMLDEEVVLLDIFSPIREDFLRSPAT